MATPAEVGTHYDELDLFYREIWGEHLHHGFWREGRESSDEAVVQLIERVVTSAGMEGHERVCDVGGGYGGTARYLATHYDARIVTLTLSEAQHKYALSRGDTEHIDYILGDWFDNDFPDSAFDVVLAIESTAHMSDKAEFFREAVRVLRPGGRLVVCAWLAAEEPADWQIRYILNPICEEGDLSGLGRMSEYTQWMAEANLTVEESEDWSANVRKTWTICLRRLLWNALRDPRYLRFALDSSRKSRRFAFTIPRMWLAYATGALRYGFFAAIKSP